MDKTLLMKRLMHRRNILLAKTSGLPLLQPYTTGRKGSTKLPNDLYIIVPALPVYWSFTLASFRFPSLK